MIDIPPDAKVIAIAGLSNTGKSTLAKKLFSDWHVIHTDDYISTPQADRARFLITLLNLRGDEEPVVVEGCEVGRILRTGLREGTWQPDVVIWCERVYDDRTKGDGTFNKGLTTIFREYLSMRISAGQEHPRIIYS